MHNIRKCQVISSRSPFSHASACVTLRSYRIALARGVDHLRSFCSTNAALLWTRRREMLRLLMADTVPRRFNFARDVVERWASERPEALALWCVREQDSGEQKLTFGQLAEELRRAARFFRANRHSARGPRADYHARVPQWWIAMLGLIRLGAVPIPGTPLLTPRDIKLPAWNRRGMRAGHGCGRRQSSSRTRNSAPHPYQGLERPGWDELRGRPSRGRSPVRPGTDAE